MGEAKPGMSRGFFAASLLIIIIMAGVLGYYGGTLTVSQKTITVTTTVPVESEKLIIGVTGKISDLDPSNAYDSYAWEVLANTMTGLMRYVPGTTELEYGMARSHVIEEDGKVYIFKLRQGLRFSDGRPADAYDVERSIKRAMKINGDPGWLLVDFVESVEALDAETVKFTLLKPVAYFLSLTATTPYFVVHPDYNPDAVDSDQTAGGLGPYRIAVWRGDVELVLETNPYYYGGAPKTRTIIVKFFATASAMRLAIEAGEIDLAWGTLSPKDIADLSGKSGLMAHEFPSVSVSYIMFNMGIPPFDNKLVRQALAAAVDRKAMAENVFMGTVKPLYSMIPLGMWSHTDDFLKKYGEKNVDLAKQLLTKAGYSETNKLKIELWHILASSTGDEVALIIKDSWEATGMVAVELRSAEATTYFEQIREKAFGASLHGWYADYIDPDDYTRAWVNQSWTGYAYVNPRLSEILEKACVLQTVEERAVMYTQAQEIWSEDAVIVPLLQGSITVVAKEDVQGIIIDPTIVLNYWLLFRTPD